MNESWKETLRIEFKRYLLGQGIELVDLDEYAEKGIATWWLSQLSRAEADMKQRCIEAVLSMFGEEMGPGRKLEICIRKEQARAALEAIETKS